MVFLGPILRTPWESEDATAGMPAALALGFLSFNETRSGGVRAREFGRMTMPPIRWRVHPFSMVPLNPTFKRPNNDRSSSLGEGDQGHVR